MLAALSAGGGPIRNRRPHFERKQRLLGRQAASETSQSSVARDHAVTGNYNRQRIGAIGRPDRARCLRIPNAPGQLSIRNRFAIGDSLQLPPDRALECCALGRERKIEFGSLTSEIFAELTHRLTHWPMLRFVPLRLRLRGAAALRKSDAMDGSGIARNEQSADGSIEVSVGHVAYFTRPACRDSACLSM